MLLAGVHALLLLQEGVRVLRLRALMNWAIDSAIQRSGLLFDGVNLRRLMKTVLRRQQAQTAPVQVGTTHLRIKNGFFR